MLGYIALYRGKRLEVRAATSLAARDEAARFFRACKAHEVSVYLCEDADGNVITQSIA